MVAISLGSVISGETMEPAGVDFFTDTRTQYGAPIYSAHRVDLHNQLIELATRKDGPGEPVKIRTGMNVIDYVRLPFSFVDIAFARR